MSLESEVKQLEISGVLKRQVKEKSLNHAYLFVCEDKVLRQELILDFIEDILNNQAQVKAKSHPDLTIIENDKQIGVKDVLDMVSDIYLAPIEADYKVYYIDDFSLASEQAQNKLLKTIENPPQSAIIILGATQTNKILQTIISRVSMYFIDGLSNEIIKNVLITDGVEVREAEIVASACNNNITIAQSLVNDKQFIEVYNLALNQFKLKSSRDVLPFLSQFNLAKIQLNVYFDLTISFARDIMMVLANKPELVNSHARIDELIEISQEFNLVSIVKIIKEAILSKENLKVFVSAQSVLDEFLLKEVEVKVKCKK